MELLGLSLLSCSCRCTTTRCDSSLEDEIPIRFVEDLEELTNVDVFLEKLEANRCSFPPGTQRTVMVVGEGSQTNALCNLLAGKEVFQGEAVSPNNDTQVKHWESLDGAMNILELDMATAFESLEGTWSKAADALGDLLLWAHRGINVLFYVVPFGPVSDDRIKSLVFLTQYLLGNALLLHFYVVVSYWESEEAIAAWKVTDVPSSLQSSPDWISNFADADFGFRHLYTLAGRNPSRFVTLPKASDIQDRSLRKALLTACGKHPVHMMPAFRMKLMQEVLTEIQVERSKLDQLQRKVADLQNELQRLPNASPKGDQKINKAFPLTPGGNVPNTKVDMPRQTWRHLEKAEQEVVAMQDILERRLQEVKMSSSFQWQVEDLATSALKRFWSDLEVSRAAKGSFASSLDKPFGKATALGHQPPAGLQFFLSTSASACMANSEDRLPTLIFDWDDTLCPTTWMRQFPEIEMMDRLKLQLHAGRIEQVLRAARSFGHVAIVTMANRQWLDQTIHLLKTNDTDLWDLLKELGIEVHYALPQHSFFRAKDAKEGISAKKVAMSAVLDKYYGDSVKARVHVLSFGDQDTEATALQEVLQAAQTKSWLRPICKVLRLPGEPDLQDLSQSLQKILTNLPALLRVESDLDLHVHSLDAR